jgi:hypothetical protein
MSLTPQPVPTTYNFGNCSGFTAVSEVFQFNVGPLCNRSGNPQLQLAFRNRYGHWDYYRFLAGKNEGLNITRQTLKTIPVDYGSATPNQQPYSRGLTDFATDMVETHVINTGFLNQPDFMFLQELWTSDQVYEIKEDGTPRPINVINTDFIIKNEGNRTVYNLELTYVYSLNITLLGK